MHYNKHRFKLFLKAVAKVQKRRKFEDAKRGILLTKIDELKRMSNDNRFSKGTIANELEALRNKINTLYSTEEASLKKEAVLEESQVKLIATIEQLKSMILDLNNRIEKDEMSFPTLRSKEEIMKEKSEAQRIELEKLAKSLSELEKKYGQLAAKSDSLDVKVLKTRIDNTKAKIQKMKS